MDVKTYIQVGDEIGVMFRSLKLQGFRGHVLEVGEGEPGTREIIIRREGTTVSEDGAIGVREDSAVFDVRRGDSWVGVPCLLSQAEAEAKSARAVVNERKRIQQKVPLFADQVQLTTRDAKDWADVSLEVGEAHLQARHESALKATAMRDQVQPLVTAEQFSQLVTARERYPGDGTYGQIFWRTQLEHIAEHGEPKLWTAPAPLTAKLSLPWLTLDAHLTWKTAPAGPQKVRVLFIGSDSIMTRLVGEPYTDYDAAHLIPQRNNWLKPNEFAEAGEFAPPPASEAACHQQA
jgi:hypothetical protein